MTTNEKERLLCYSAGIIGSTLSNPNNVYSAEQLTNTSIRAAYKLINTIMDDKKREEILNEKV